MRLGLVGFALAGAVLLTIAGGEPVVAAVQQSSALDGLVARCTEAMVRDICVARRPAANSSPAPQVFVAGVGAIDANAYAEIRSAGEAMCGVVKKRCGQGWNDSACVAARSLWPATASPRLIASR
ncbi:MAG TPA: hypothetical protein VGQ91_19610 [Ideonella sp.]|nr:hypothetical protein [Ideonella sp.]